MLVIRTPGRIAVLNIQNDQVARNGFKHWPAFTNVIKISIAFDCYQCYGSDYSFVSLNCVITLYTWTNTIMANVKHGQSTICLGRGNYILHFICIPCAYLDKRTYYKIHGFITNSMTEAFSWVVSNTTFYTAEIAQTLNLTCLSVTIENGRWMSIAGLLTFDTYWTVIYCMAYY